MHEDLGLRPDEPGRLWRFEPRGRLHHRHTHAEPEFNLILRGTARYLLADRRYDLVPGSLVWLFPSQEHVLVNLSRDLQGFIGVIHPQALQRLAGTSHPGLLADDPPGEWSRRLPEADVRFLAALCHDLATTADAATRRAGLGYAMLAAWTRFLAAPSAARPELHPAVARAAHLLAEDPGLDGDSLARRSGLSRTRLSRLFHAQMDTTLLAWRTRQRVEAFLRLRREKPGRTVLATALDAGFGSQAQLYRSFRQITGSTPEEWDRPHVTPRSRGQAFPNGTPVDRPLS